MGGERREASSDREIVTTRRLRAPRELVWQAWTDPQHLCQWWGPRGFRITTRSIELREGGQWQFVMHGPDGRDFVNHIVFRELRAPDRVVYDHVSGPTFRVTATFEQDADPDYTRLTMRAVFDSEPGYRTAVHDFGAVEGARQTTERLQELLARQRVAPFVHQRTVAAPRDRVWRVWTDPQHLLRWSVPKGAKVRSLQATIARGGMLHTAVETPDGKTMWGKWVFREVSPPDCLVFVNSFSDEAAGNTRHPLSAEWPLELLTTVHFAEVAGGTQITIEWVPLDAAPSELAVFDAGRTGMSGGWNNMLDLLAAYLAQPEPRAPSAACPQALPDPQAAA